MRLPMIVAGERVDATSAGEAELRSRTGREIRFVQLDAAHAQRITTQPRDVLQDVPLHEIVAFLHNVGHNWKSREYTRRRLYERYLCQYLGYSEKMAETEANWIALLLSSHYRQLDTLAAELGAWQMLDGWVPREEAMARAYPRGRVLHVVPGNVPLSTVVSVLRAVVTKNSSVVKASSDDPVTPVALAQSFADIDPDHPVTRSLSVVHWKGGKEEPHHLRLAQEADLVCAWGGEEAIAWARRHAGPATDVLAFGPRRSVAVVGHCADLRKAARALAHDVAMYNQRACFSVQHAYVEQASDSFLHDFVYELELAFRDYERLLPHGEHEWDERAGASLARLHAAFAGAEVRCAVDRSWSIVTGTHEVEHHPLTRTLFVHPVKQAADAVAFVGPDVQTAAVWPETLAVSLRDALARRGVSRVVELGMNNVFRVGGAHDGMYPLQRLVRIATMELPSSVHIKGIAVRIDQTTFLEEGRFLEFIP